MSLPLLITLAVVVIAIAAIWFIASSRRRREHENREIIRRRMGPEFDRQAERHGGMSAAVDKIHERRETLQPRPLTPGERDRYSREWHGIQNAFLDRPGLALIEADRMVSELMRDRGMSHDDVDDAALDLSLEHKSVADRFRSAHEIVQSGSSDIGEQREAMLHYRTVVDDLLAVNLREQQVPEHDDPLS